MACIREHKLLKPGDRVGVAVSGGADSVALLRVLLELRSALGIVLSVLHFNHKIRGADADEDERFVGSLAEHHGLEFHCSSADVPAYAAAHKLSLETAGRQARYRFFESFFPPQKLDEVATGHTMDDQAETVLMRVLRGAGTRGLAGIYPKKAASCGGAGGCIVRPLLEIRRAEARCYLKRIGQTWREDATNMDLEYTRNRIRHGLIPLIEARFQPGVVTALAQLAEVAREEENYWQAELNRVAPEVSQLTSTGITLELSRLRGFPPALERRILRDSAQRLGISMDFEHLCQVLQAVHGSDKVTTCELPGGWRAVRQQQELRFELRRNRDRQKPSSYEYHLSIPGEVEVKEIGRVVRTFLQPVKADASGYNSNQFLDAAALGPELLVRNWRAGDRLWPLHSKGPKKIKELFDERHVPRVQRQAWPVAVSGSNLVWSREFGISREFQARRDAKQVVAIEERILHNPRER